MRCGVVREAPHITTVHLPRVSEARNATASLRYATENCAAHPCCIEEPGMMANGNGLVPTFIHRSLYFSPSSNICRWSATSATRFPVEPRTAPKFNGFDMTLVTSVQPH